MTSEDIEIRQSVQSIDWEPVLPGQEDIKEPPKEEVPDNHSDEMQSYD